MNAEPSKASPVEKQYEDDEYDYYDDDESYDEDDADIKTKGSTTARSIPKDQGEKQIGRERRSSTRGLPEGHLGMIMGYLVPEVRDSLGYSDRAVMKVREIATNELANGSGIAGIGLPVLSAKLVPRLQERSSRVMQTDNKNKRPKNLSSTPSLYQAALQEQTETGTHWSIAKSRPRRRGNKKKLHAEIEELEPDVAGEGSPSCQCPTLTASAAHFVGNHYLRCSSSTHSEIHCRGNLLSHASGNGNFRGWTPARWVQLHPSFRFNVNDGVLSVLDPGLYYVYAQIEYINDKDKMGFNIHHNRSGHGTIDKAFHCKTTILGIAPSGQKRKTCYTGGILLLQTNDELFVKEEASMGGTSWTMFNEHRSFFGLFKIGHARR